ncbi:MAG: hydroxyacylglutathione hydrolase [Bdellovibrionota bacterium]
MNLIFHNIDVTRQFNMRVELIPVFDDNYVFILIDDLKKEAAVVDPATADSVISFLEKENLTLTKIFNTHHHSDHIGGNLELLRRFPSAEVYAGIHDKGRIPAQKYFLNHDDTVYFTEEKATVYYVPGHTLGHIAYHFALKDGQHYLFIGDTIFSGGCGRLFEGTFEQMFESLKFLRDNLPNETIIFCAHEYTVNNYKKLSKLEPGNENIKNKLEKCIQMRNENLFTVPFTLGEEKKCSSILRWDDKNLMKIANSQTGLETFTFVRNFLNKPLG